MKPTYEQLEDELRGMRAQAHIYQKLAEQLTAKSLQALPCAKQAVAKWILDFAPVVFECKSETETAELAEAYAEEVIQLVLPSPSIPPKEE